MHGALPQKLAAQSDFLRQGVHHGLLSLARIHAVKKVSAVGAAVVPVQGCCAVPGLAPTARSDATPLLGAPGIPSLPRDEE